MTMRSDLMLMLDRMLKHRLELNQTRSSVSSTMVDGGGRMEHVTQSFMLSRGYEFHFM